MTHAWKTLADRQLIAQKQFADAMIEIEARLCDYGIKNHGRFHLFGSAVRGPVHDQSDVDILVDFGDNAVLDAQDFAEKTCVAFGLQPDVRPMIWTSKILQQRALDEGRTCP